MGETIARIGAASSVELVDEKSTPLEGAKPMTPSDAAYLARGLLSCAAVLSIHSPKAGSIIADAHLPVLKCVVSNQTGTRQPVLLLTIPGGVELTFLMTAQMEKELGQTLVAHAEGKPAPAVSPTPLH